MHDHIQAVWAIADEWQRASLIALAVATFGQTMFVLIYGTRTWWRSRVGRALLLKSASFCAVLWLTLVGAFFIYDHEEQVSAVALWVVAVAIIYQLVALLLSPRNPSS